MMSLLLVPAAIFPRTSNWLLEFIRATWNDCQVKLPAIGTATLPLLMAIGSVFQNTPELLVVPILVDRTMPRFPALLSEIEFQPCRIVEPVAEKIVEPSRSVTNPLRSKTSSRFTSEKEVVSSVTHVPLSLIC